MKQIKELLRSYQNQLETSLITQSIKAMNPMGIIKDHCLDSALLSNRKTGGEHSRDYFDQNDHSEVMEEIQSLNAFSADPGRDKITFVKKIRTVWDDLEPSRILVFLSRNQHNYRFARNTNFV